MAVKLHNLKFTEGSRVEKHRKGRGHAAGKGKQAGKGQSGQNKRKGHRLGLKVDKLHDSVVLENVDLLM